MLGIKRKRAVALEKPAESPAAELRHILDRVPIAVIAADLPDFRITYVNEETRRTVARLRHLLPVGPDELVGRSIDIFHKDPAHQQRLLSNPARLPHQARIRLGDEILDLNVAARHDSDGRYVGALLTWAVVTDKARMEAETARLMRMLEDMPINVLTCDAVDFRITYANRASLETLKRIEHVLPVKAEQVLGSSIDVFHKTPVRQRTMLADPRNLPHRALISLGDERLDLKVSAITAGDGSYLGPMLTWNVVSDQVRITSRVEEVVAVVASAATEMEAAAATLARTAEVTSSQAAEVASAADETGASVQAIASACEELAASVEEIGQRVADASASAGEAATEVGAATSTVEGLSDAAQRIGDVVSLITSIANQTNLLALNATIEAARAGEAGKGFAVVASEVKNLANQTAKATEDIARQVEEIQTATAAAVAAITRISGRINKVDEIAASIAAAIEEQGAATREIARNIQQASAGARAVSNTIAGVSEGAHETGAAAAQVVSAAGELNAQSAGLKADVAAFVASLSR
jgi:methyl-accepting chemotaxis protein